MPTIAIANQKGGVGKTTISGHLGRYLADTGRAVLLIDGDPQANLTSWMLDGRQDLPCSLLEVVLGHQPLDHYCRTPSLDRPLDVITATPELGDLYKFLAASSRPFNTLFNAVHTVTDLYHYTLIDCPPSRNAGFLELLFCADWILIPTVLQRLSLEGVNLMAQVAQQINASQGAGPRLLAVVPNMIRARTNEHRGQLEALVDVLGDHVWPPIPDSIRVPEAISRGLTLFEHAPRAPVTQCMETLCSRFLQNLEHTS